MKLSTKGLLLLVGFAVPSALAALFVFGCCILPFHKYLHRAMPLCHVASALLSGHHEGTEHDNDHAATPPPSREKQSLSVRLAENAFQTFSVTADVIRHRTDPALTHLRSFIAPGAVRCESDVGLLLLIANFRI